MKRKPIVASAFAVLVAAALGAGLWWVSRPREPAAANEAPREAAARAPASPSSSPGEPAIRYPIETAQSDQRAPPLDFRGALDDLFGARTVPSTFLVDDFARRFVATIDNLGRSGASSRLWPVVPTAGRFSVAEADGGAAIATANAARYEPFVRLIEGVDLHRAAGAYIQLYPSLQRAYEELGYPKSYFNDRFVDVLDLLLATPEPASPPKVHLPAVNGPVQPQRPWVLYEFDDPQLEALAAGQKILVRMGLDNERRVKARLAELRGLVAATPTRR
jgi:hypothetical protein